MRFKQLCFAALTSLFVLSSQASAQIITSEAEPETDVLLDTIEGAIVATLIDGTGGPGARGENFQLGEAGESFAISGVTIEANQARTFAAGETFTVTLFTGDPFNDFAPVTSPGAFANVTPQFLVDNSQLTLIHEEDFLGTDATGDAPDGQVGLRNFVTFQLSEPVVVPGGEGITLMIFTNFAFAQVETNRIVEQDGRRIQFRDTRTSLFPSSSRNLRFSVSGVAVGDGPELEPDVLKGDVNMDDEVTFLDISPFIMALTAGEGPAEADCNCDGEVNFLDIAVFINKLAGGTP